MALAIIVVRIAQIGEVGFRLSPTVTFGLIKILRSLSKIGTVIGARILRAKVSVKFWMFTISIMTKKIADLGIW